MPPPTALADLKSSLRMARPDAAREGGSVDWTRWPIVGLLSIGAIIAYCDRTNISAALGVTRPSCSNFQLSDIGRGVLSSAFFWSYMVCRFRGLGGGPLGTKIPIHQLCRLVPLPRRSRA